MRGNHHNHTPHLLSKARRVIVTAAECVTNLMTRSLVVSWLWVLLLSTTTSGPAAITSALSMMTTTTTSNNDNSALLSGKRVLVTGAGRGIGQAIALLCHQHGARVAICARSATQLQETADKAKKNAQNGDINKNDDDDDRLLLHTADVTQPDQVRGMVNAIVDQWGGLDILINNAGRGQSRKASIADLGDKTQNDDDDDFLSLLQLNVVAVQTVTAACVPHLSHRDDDGEGQIINISSKAGKMGLPNMSQYAASKFALEGLTAAWAAELDGDVRVNSISPGMVDTDGFPKPDGRPGVRTAESVADGLLFLLTGTTTVTGHYLHVDELDLVRSKGLPDERALKRINEPTFADTL